MIKIYPSTLQGEPLETYDISGITLHEWLTDNVKDYTLGDTQPISATVNGEIVAPVDWPKLMIGEGDIVELHIQPGKSAFKAAFGIIGTILAVFDFLMPQKAKNQSVQTAQQGEKVAGAEVEANQPKLGDSIPELAGRHRRYPDYLNQPRKYFVDTATQAVDVMMCVTMGKCSLPESKILIGKTPIETLGDKFMYQQFGPDEDVTSHQAHRCWYNAPEVGSTTGSAGLRLLAGEKGTRFVDATMFDISGSSITIPVSAGLAPQDWEVGGIVDIKERTRTVTVSGGITEVNVYRGDFSGLDLSVGDTFEMVGEGLAGNVYKVDTYTDTVNIAGNASSITGVKVAPLSYQEDVTFTIGVSNITLTSTYSDADDLVAAINLQLAGATCSHVNGELSIIEQFPFSGSPISLSGYFDPVFGASPTRVTGVKTQSYSEMTLSVLIPRSGFTPMASGLAGTFANVGISKVAVGSLGQVTSRWGNKHRITSLIKSGADTIGWEFAKLKEDGTPDVNWLGFYDDIVTPNVTMEYDQTEVVGGWLGPFLACPQGEQTDIIEWDLFASGGLGSISSSGGIYALRRSVELQYRNIGQGDSWASVVVDIEGRERDQLGWTFTVNLPSQMTPEVRVRRLQVEDKRTSAMDKLEWYGLKTLLPSPTKYAGSTTMAATLIGSNEIAARTENKISVVASRILPVRESGAWQAEQVTSDIVPFVCHIAKSIGYTDSELDLEELDRLDAIWKARGDKFDFIFNKPTPVRDCINDVLFAGFAEMTVDAGKIRPVRNELRSQFEHMYTPQNMTKSLKRSFTLRQPNDSDGIDVEYIDPETWVKQVVECRLSGDTGFKVTKIKADGVLSRTRAWRIGMRLRREQRYQRWKYSFSTEMDALNSRYMSYCALGDDVPGYGQSAWIKDIVTESTGVAALLVSEPLDWSAGGSHVLAWRKEDGTLAGPYPATMGDDEFEVLVEMPKPWPNPYLQQEPPQILFGTPERWTFPSLITKVSPRGLDSVSVSAVNYAPEVYLDDDNAPLD